MAGIHLFDATLANQIAPRGVASQRGHGAFA
jgi:hypothetical protein